MPEFQLSVTNKRSILLDYYAAGSANYRHRYITSAKHGATIGRRDAQLAIEPIAEEE